MKINQQHIIEDINYIPSPNFNERPTNSDIDLIVLHSISLPPKQYHGNAISEYFCNQLDFAAHPFYESLRDIQVSSHVLIRRSGEIIQYVPFDKRAWHAGESCFEDRVECNDYSIGIEIEGDEESEFPMIQYQQLAKVINVLAQRYSKLTMDRIVGHETISPGRKADPGPYFDWQCLRKLLVI